MIFPSFSAGLQLNIQDFFFLRRQFSREINTILPVQATLIFWGQQSGCIAPESEVCFSSTFQKQLSALCDSGKPGRADKLVVIPVPVTDGEHVAVILQDVDQGLSGKMADEWLLELQGEMREGLLREKQSFVDPGSGLYNNNLLEICLDQLTAPPVSLFLINVLYRSRQAGAGLRKIAQTARVLESSAAGQACYLGGNLYAIYQEGLGRDDALGQARRLLGRLKREGAQRVHVGIAVFAQEDGADGKSALPDHAWQALEVAERRGPFSLCEASFILNREKLPLARPADHVIRQLQRIWRGQDRFGLLLFRAAESKKVLAKGHSLGQTLSGLIGAEAGIVEVSPGEAYVVLPGMDAQQTGSCAKQMKKKLTSRIHPAGAALGICSWPYLDYTRTETARNCRKALMHGDFFGPDSSTVFDQVSLNVSGDFFYDEGDYRQAVRDYQAGLQIDPENVNLLNSLGVALTALNRHRQAGRYFEQVLAGNPHNFMALVNKGFALRMQGLNDEALAFFEKAARSRKFAGSSVFVDISLQLGRLYCRHGKYRKAIGVLAKLEHNDPDKQGGYFYGLLGEAYAGTKKYSMAIDALQHAVRLNPHDAKSLSLLGEMYAREQQGSEIALVFCEKALAINDRPWEYWYRLALVRYLTSDNDGAAVAIRESLRRGRKGAEPLFLAGEIFTRLGQTRKAVTMFRRFAALKPDDIKVRKELSKLEGKQ